MRTVLAAVATWMVLIGLLATPAAADTGADEVAIVARVNQLRSTLGIPPLAIKGELFDVARAWSARQAATGAASHNTGLTRQLPDTWIRAAENVASGPEIWMMLDALVASPGHVVHMLDARFDSVGVGIVQAGNGQLYATMVFMTTGTPRARCRQVSHGRCVLR